MILRIISDYPEIPEQLSPEVHAIVFNLMDLIRRACAAQKTDQMDPEKAVEATIAWAREKHPEVSSKTPEELAQILRHRGLSISK